MQGDEQARLDVAALEIAAIEYPRLDPGPFLEILDSHARELEALAPQTASAEDYVAAANQYLFADLAFRGNQEDYYNPHNSCLNDVLLTRKGIPITLSLVYMEVARRLGRPVVGVGLPGHFLVQYQDASYSPFIDCYYQGRILTVEDCRDLAIQVSKVDIFRTPSLLHPVSKRQIVIRMLNNLRGIYYQQDSYEKAIRVLDWLLEAEPESAEEHKQRGVLHLHCKRPRYALADLQRYLTLAPNAPDHGEIEKQTSLLRQYLQSLN